MPDNWSFVAAAYGLAAVVLVLYWRFLVRREKELDDAGVVRQQLRHGSGAPEPQAAQRGPLP
jgi:hypothetical protein